MPLRLEEITAKRAHIEEQIASVSARESITKRFGGATIRSFADELEFQQGRLDFLIWLEARAAAEDEAAIRAKMADDLAALGDGGPTVLATGHVAGLPVEAVATVFRIEAAQLALGEHPAQIARAPRLATREE